jgi:hypothetical protein
MEHHNSASSRNAFTEGIECELLVDEDLEEFQYDDKAQGFHGEL